MQAIFYIILILGTKIFNDTFYYQQLSILYNKHFLHMDLLLDNNGQNNDLGCNYRCFRLCSICYIFNDLL